MGGDFRTSAGGLPASKIARWNGAAWSALGTGFENEIRALTTLPNGDLIAGGNFRTAGSIPARRIARWNGAVWSALGTGIGTAVGGPQGGGVWALTTLPNGDVVAGGPFDTAGGVPSNGIARWNGSAWTALGTGMSVVRALTTLPNGDLVAGGGLQTAGGTFVFNIARWNGTAWSALGAGFNFDVLALTALPNGDLVAGGIFNNGGFNQIARWNGTAWLPLGTGTNGTVNALTALPNGDLVVGGLFSTAGGAPANRIARWNGTSWSAFGTGVNSTVSALQAMPNGDLVVGGQFLTANDAVSAYLARLSTTCPATSASYGAGCPSSGGSNTLVATTPPWVDAHFRATGTGLPTNALVLTLTSVTSISQGAVPLALGFPQAVPGCDVLTVPDILGVLVTTTGTAQSSLFLPNSPPLVGVTFYHQMVPIELDGLGNWVAVTATNALQLTAGAF